LQTAKQRYTEFAAPSAAAGLICGHAMTLSTEGRLGRHVWVSALPSYMYILANTPSTLLSW